MSKRLHVPVWLKLCREEGKDQANRHKHERRYSDPKIVTHQTFLPNVFSKNPCIPLSNVFDHTANSSDFCLSPSNCKRLLLPCVVTAESKEAISEQKESYAEKMLNISEHGAPVVKHSSPVTSRKTCEHNDPFGVADALRLPESVLDNQVSVHTILNKMVRD